MAFTTVPTQNVGDTWTAANHNTYIRDNFTWVNTYRGCQVIRTVTQTISHNSETSVVFDGENHDTDSFHSNSVNPERITIPAGYPTGYYQLYFTIQWASSNAGNRYVRFYKNAANTHEWLNNIPVTGIREQNGIWVLSLAAGDYISLKVIQTSGGDLGLNAGSYFGLRWLGA